MRTENVTKGRYDLKRNKLRKRRKGSEEIHIEK